MSGRPGEGVSLRRDFIAAARAALASRPVAKRPPPLESAETLDEREPNLDPYRAMGAWQ